MYAYLKDFSRGIDFMEKNNKFYIKIFFLFIAIVFAVYFINIRPAIANHYLELGFRQIQRGNEYNSAYRENNQKEYQKLAQENFEQGVASMEKAISYNTYGAREFRERFAETIIGFHQAETLPRYKAAEYFDKVLVELEKNILENKTNVQVYAYTMTAYNIGAIYDLKRLNRAIELGEIALSISPERPQIYSEIAKSKISQKKYDESILYFQKAIQIRPDVVMSHWNLAQAYIKINKMDEAKKEIKIMEDLGYSADTMAEIERWIGLYKKVSDYDKLILLYNKMIYLMETYQEKVGKDVSGITDEEIASWYKKGATNYYNIGDLENAKAYIQKAIDLDKSLQEDINKF